MAKLSTAKSTKGFFRPERPPCRYGLNQEPCHKIHRHFTYLVAADPAGLEGLGGELLQLAGHQVHAQRELIHARLLPVQIFKRSMKFDQSSSTDIFELLFRKKN